ncbi:ATP synthase subunit I [Caloranaerobacter azorensis]|uniref:ATP synthase I chain n=2 Tax=Caloranaerobacter azorensis TaxID=116090 RepID=A0A1M5W3V8_9FIRM|nr:ATP synthase subunit I [Caloranaerobacter azorensis]QIB27657.1 ATP synthase subunit I [Caloranaerobacter azorensis]SHH82155.1 ATP synthase I chain [Caloranaerobacter azorensis DSM 13643]
MSLQDNIQYKIIKRVFILTILIIGVFFLVFPEPMPYIYGIIFGATINVLNFRLMSLTLEKAVGMSNNKIMPYVVGNYMVRYLIYGIVLTISAIADYINFYSTVLGIFMVKTIIISDTFYDIIKGKKTSKMQN